MNARSLLCVALGLTAFIALAPAAQAAPTCFGREATIMGTNGPDELEGREDRADVIVAKAGADRAVGLGRADRVCMGAGSDRFGPLALAAPNETGDDRIDLGGGDDGAIAGPGADLVLGKAGNDLGMRGEAGRDRLFTGEGNDCLPGRARPLDAGGGDDLVDTGPGNDCKIDGGPGDDDLFGGDGDDTQLKDHSGADEFYGGDGSDELDAQDDEIDDKLRGGPLNDVCLRDAIIGVGSDDAAECEP